MVKFGPIEKLGTVWWFEFFDLKNENEKEVLKKVEQILEDFEDKYSRFREDSIISKLNKDKRLENPDPELAKILELSKKFYVQTGGIFNVLVGDYLEMTGYDKEYNFSKKIESLPKVPDLNTNLRISSDEIILGESAKVDLGGIGKGFLIDKLVDIFKNEFKLKSFLINGGGDIYATEKEIGGEIEGFEIGLKDPNSKDLIGKVVLQNQGFAASSPNLRSWKGSDGKTYSHIVGSDKPRNTFVVASTACQADVWATTLSIDPEIEVPEGIFGKLVSMI